MVHLLEITLTYKDNLLRLVNRHLTAKSQPIIDEESKLSKEEKYKLIEQSIEEMGNIIELLLDFRHGNISVREFNSIINELYPFDAEQEKKFRLDRYNSLARKYK